MNSEPTSPPPVRDTDAVNSTHSSLDPSKGEIRSPRQHGNLPAIETSVQTTTQPETQAESTFDLKEPPPFFYNHVTDEKIQEWKQGGRDLIVEQACQRVHGDSSRELNLLYFELIRSALDNRIGPEEAGNAVSMIFQQAPKADHWDTAEMFLDAVTSCPGVDINNPRLKPLLFSTRIPADTMRLALEDNLLVTLGLVRPAFTRMFIRKQTNILYKQSNYNLLREESEGYSKLMTELFTVSQNEDPTSDIVHETFENVKSLIGAFDLDAGRVLDVILDVSAGMLIRNPRFIVKLLRISDYWPHDSTFPVSGSDVSPLPSWAHPEHYEPYLDEHEKEQLARAKQERDEHFWEAVKNSGIKPFFALGRRAVVDEQTMEAFDSAADDPLDAYRQNLRNWIQSTGTLPPTGNYVAAQLLGFKLRFYGSNARDKSDIEPPSLSYLAAMLIKIGFISLFDLYPHLFPAENVMDSVKEKGMNERVEREQSKRPGATTNALSRAAALTDDTLPPPSTRVRDTTERADTPGNAEAREGTANSSKDNSTTTEQLPDPPEQKILLLKNLLLIGALPESLFLLGRFPWLLETVPDIANYISRVIDHCLSKVHAATRENIGDNEQDILAKKPQGVSDFSNSRAKKWAQMDNAEYRFYWDEWADNIPTCQTVDDVFTLCDTFVNLIGVKIGQDDDVLIKVAQIGRCSLRADTSVFNRDRWQDLLKRLLCPALSLTKISSMAVKEVYSLLNSYPAAVRYNIYSEWFMGATSRQLDIKEAFDLARYRTRDVMKKVNKDKPLQQAKALANAAMTSPGIVFEVFINQLENYDNMIDAVVDCGQYFTDLGYDVLSWQILNFLGREGRSRVSGTGFLANKWLISLSSFTGKVLAKYSQMSIRPFLLYVFNQLQQKNYTDLRVLRDVILYMSGTPPLTDLTDKQLLAMTGGDHLVRVVFEEFESNLTSRRTSTKRLMESLLENETGGKLLIVLAQALQTCVYHHNQEESKILSEIYDEITVVFKQYLDMLLANLSLDEFEDFVPDIVALMSEYGLETRTAFTIHRKSLTHAITEYDKQHNLDKYKGIGSTSSNPIPIQDGNVANHSDTDIVMGGIEQPAADEALVVETAQIEQLSNGGALVAEKTQTIIPNKSPCHPMLESLVESIRQVLGPDFEKTLSVSFYVTFWQLSLADLLPPTESYEECMKKQLRKKAAIVPNRRDISRDADRRRAAERKQIDEVHEGLMTEMRAGLRRYAGVQNRLILEKDHWFKNFHHNWKEHNFVLLQECFLPRLVLSPLDALYAHKILFWLHGKGTKCFRISVFLDQMLEVRALTNIIYQCSTRECENLGRFLNEVLKTLHEWHGDKKEYEKKVVGVGEHKLVGFARKMTEDGQINGILDYEEFRGLVFKWHCNLHKVLKKCLEDWEYMHVKNAITIIHSIASQFPKVSVIGQDLLKTIRQLIQREQPPNEGEAAKPLARRDLSTSANSVLSYVKRGEKKWIATEAFKLVKTKAAPAPAAIDTQNSRPAQRGPKSLDAKAPEFVSKQDLQNHAPPMSAVSVEDGELKETPTADVRKPSVVGVASTPLTQSVNGAVEKRGRPATPNQQSKAEDQIAEKEIEASNQTKETGQQSDPQAATIQSPNDNTIEEDDRLAIQRERAMEAVKRRNDAYAKNPDSKAKDAEGKPDQPIYPIDASANQTLRPSTRSNATNQAPEVARGERDRSSRHPSSENRDPYRQSEGMHQSSMLRHPGERGPPRYSQDSARPVRHPDMSYGRLNTDPDASYGSNGRGYPRSGPATSQAPYGDRRQSDVSNSMGPPPPRDYGPPGNRAPYGSYRGPGPATRQGGPPFSPTERLPSVNTERAMTVEQRPDPQAEGRLSHNDVPLYAPDNARQGANRPSSPKRPRYSEHTTEPPSPKRPRYSDHGALIRGRANGPSAEQMPPQQGQAIQSPSQPSRNSTSTSGIHPSRLEQIEGASRPAPIQTSVAETERRGHSQASYPPSPANAPSGPRSATLPSAQSPSSYGPPTGPSGPHGNGSYGRNEGHPRQYSHMQDTMNQSNNTPRYTNGTGPARNSSSSHVPQHHQHQQTSRSYQDDTSPPSSRGYDSRNGPARMPYPARDTQPAPSREVSSASHDMRGIHTGPSMSQPPSTINATPEERIRNHNRERSPNRGAQRETRERDYTKDYRNEPRTETREFRERRSERGGLRERLERPPRAETRGGRSDYGERRESGEQRFGYTAPESTPDTRGGRSGWSVGFRGGERREAQRSNRELMPEGPSGGREGPSARLRDYERGEGRRDGREERGYWGGGVRGGRGGRRE